MSNPYLSRLIQTFGATIEKPFFRRAEEIGVDAAFLEFSGDKAALAQVQREHKVIIERVEREQADASAIKDALEKANREIKIDRNARTSGQARRDRVNKMIDACSLECTPKGILSKEAVDRLNTEAKQKVKWKGIGGIDVPVVHQAVGSFQGQKVPLELVVKWD